MRHEPRLPDVRLALIDVARKTRIGKFRSAMARSEWYLRERLESLQLERLETLLDFAVGKVPFYRDLATAKGLTEETGLELTYGAAGRPTRWPR